MFFFVNIQNDIVVEGDVVIENGMTLLGCDVIERSCWVSYGI